MDSPTKKPRFSSRTMKFNKPTKINNYKINPDGSLDLYSDDKKVTPERATAEIHFKKDNGKNKITLQIPLDPQKILITNEFFLNYDYIISIDTATKNNGTGYYLSASCCVEIQIINKKIHRETKHFSACFKHTEPVGEKRGIWRVIKNINSKKENIGKKIIIITDHDLGQLDAYNKQKKYFFEKNYLPSNFTLFYASADKKNDSFLNQIMYYCDDHSKKILQKYISSQNQ